MKILCIHGVGHQDAKTGWQDAWRLAITSGLQSWNPALAPEFRFPAYDDLFAAAPLNALSVVEALARLTASGLFYGLVDLFRSRRGFGDTLEAVRWTAGMVAQWAANEELRQQARTALAAEIQAFQPDLILAHSLGSLILYDALKRDETAGGTLADGRTILTFGSQIGNPAVRSHFGGRVDEFARARMWWHLYNEEDAVFTAPIAPTSHDRFRQVDTWFDLPGLADHDASAYLAHENARLTVWQDVACGAAPTAKARALAPSVGRPLDAALRREVRAPQMRALLVGVADYPNATDVLDGPVNDVFLMSSLLQELGFPPDSIRVVLNERATAAGIRERLQWLLGDARDGDTLFFHFSGHGAQLPAYGRDAEVDHIDECLVPYDFDWKAGTAITDDEFCALYSQLPYGAQFTAALDCCHAGGMARAGGARVRGLTPPDDIRHRAIAWDRELQMWIPRQSLVQNGKDRARRYLVKAADQARFLGAQGTVNRLGRGTSLWLDRKAYASARGAYGHHGPYMPILLEACDEGESAFEYRHGATSYGAFTFALCEAVRDVARRNRERARMRKPALPFTFRELEAALKVRIGKVVREPQTPQLVCPKGREADRVPGV